MPAIFKAVLIGQSWTFLFCHLLPGDQAWRPLIHTCLNPISAHVSNTFMMTSPRWPSTALWGSSLKIYMTLSSFWDSKLWRVTEKRVTCVSDSFVYYSPTPLFSFYLCFYIFEHLMTAELSGDFGTGTLKQWTPKNYNFSRSPMLEGKGEGNRTKIGTSFHIGTKTFPQLWVNRYVCVPGICTIFSIAVLRWVKQDSLGR